MGVPKSTMQVLITNQVTRCLLPLRVRTTARSTSAKVGQRVETALKKPTPLRTLRKDATAKCAGLKHGPTLAAATVPSLPPYLRSLILQKFGTWKAVLMSMFLTPRMRVEIMSQYRRARVLPPLIPPVLFGNARKEILTRGVSKRFMLLVVNTPNQLGKRLGSVKVPSLPRTLPLHLQVNASSSTSWKHPKAASTLFCKQVPG
mmetsp:Transcript_23318/g.37972  ORF Transcript_23318/g.37972 Transcript_23318/m.37972 type:complete len:203 (+) Transcript_23318:1034-1642(+)